MLQSVNLNRTFSYKKGNRLIKQTSEQVTSGEIGRNLSGYVFIFAICGKTRLNIGLLRALSTPSGEIVDNNDDRMNTMIGC